MKVSINTKHMKILACLSSKTRIKILELLGEGPKNIGELAGLLHVSSAITTRHVSMLEDAGIIHSENIPGKRGLQKVCYLIPQEIILSFEKEARSRNYHMVSIPIGQYVAYKVTPTCGLASTEGYIGMSDDPRYFSDPNRVKAAILWFHTGWVEYRIPSYVLSPQPIHAVEISMEICSEFPNYKENWPSDIHFYLNNVLLGVWTSPGDFGHKEGIYTPQWWRAGSNYGLLKTLRITATGCMLDGIKLSDVTIDHIPMEQGQDLILKIAVPEDARNPGGINLFGKGFGNYQQDIKVIVEYE
jgi:predicted transcriptional regulator